jgi:hypothetical protein
MRHLVGILTALAMLGIASGGIDYVHLQQVQRQTDEWLASQHAQGQPTPPPFRHDSANCVICLILHLPLAALSVQAIVAALGLLAISDLLRPSAPALVRLVLPMDCRGPPLD